ncbi:MAG: hypothetical protein MI753_07170, partial [Hyphomicrobiales bacterium]|nr:hypothetical protein [Hyphomicrobiales bacterium]
IPDETVSCFDVPSVPHCVPTLCDVQPLAKDGTDLVVSNQCVSVQPVPERGCTDGCHQGIENIHPWFGGPELTCVACHGGDDSASSREAAHVSMPDEWQLNAPVPGRPNYRYYWNYLTLSGVENFSGGLEWLRFRNPSDLRVADQTCGRSLGCHFERVENVSAQFVLIVGRRAAGAV